MTKIYNYINGELIAPASGEWFHDYAPATGEWQADIPDSDERDVEQAVACAQAALKGWSSTPAAQRSHLLRRIADEIERRFDEFVTAESDDAGKPKTLAAELDIPRAIANLRFFASAGEVFSSEAHPMADGTLNYTLRQPVGVAACISPWNLPLYLFTWKIAPALVSGCTVVAKPSEFTPVTAFMLAKIAIKVGLPPGVLNIVNGYGAKVGAPLVAHKDVRAVSFTGGTVTGKAIATATAGQFKKVALEMGGKNPFIVFADAPFEKAVENAVQASFRNQGEICLCGSRIYVEERIYGKFKREFVKRAKRLLVGDPRSISSDQGALISSGHFEKVMNYIKQAKREGGTILCGGRAVKLEGRCAGGWFVAPTVIEGLSLDCKTNQEEIFGPVVTLAPFQDDVDAIRLANGTPYGLAASIWTENLSRAHKVAAELDFGIVWVNCWMLRDLRTPFGGAKLSGQGREGGLEALRFFTEPKNICIKL